MSRGGVSDKKFKAYSDVKYNNFKVTKFINLLMRDGKKAKAEIIFYKAIKQLGVKLNIDPVAAFEQAIDNARPKLEARRMRMGGATYPVPVELTLKRSLFLAMKNVISCSKNKKSTTMIKALVGEMADAYLGKGSAIKIKEDKHKMAESNRAFARLN